MNLPEKFPYKTSIFYGDRELNDQIPYDEEQAIPHYKLRNECKEELIEKLLRRLWAFFAKNKILKKVLTHKSSLKEPLLHTIIEDACKQNITDLIDLSSEFMKIVNLYRGKYIHLFINKSQETICSVLYIKFKVNEQKIRRFDQLIQEARDRLFGSYNNKGQPKNECFDNLNSRIENIRREVKGYRDKIAAHHDLGELIVTWETLDKYCLDFRQICYDLYSVITFEKNDPLFEEPMILGTDCETIIRVLLESIYSN